MGAKRSIRDKLKGFYHDVRGSVSADYRSPEQKAAAAKPITKPKLVKKSKKKKSSSPFSLAGAIKTVRQRKKEIDIRDYLK